MAKQAATPPKESPKPPPKIGTGTTVQPPPKRTAMPPEVVLTKSSNAQAKDFGDETIKGGFSERPEGFRGKTGMTYIARIVTKPIMFAGAYVENHGDKSKSFFMASRAPFDIAKAAMDGDRDAETQAKLECPLFEREYKVKPRFCVGLWVVCTIDSKGRATMLKKFYPWTFAGERYQNLTSIGKALPTLANGDRLKIQQVELQMTCTDDGFQKFNITPITSARDIKMKSSEVWAECSQFFEGDSPDSPCYLIEETIAPDSRRDMIASLDRAEGRGKNQAVEEVDEVPRGRQTQTRTSERPAQGQRRPAAPAQEPDGDEETTRAIDEALGDLGGNDGGGDPDASVEADEFDLT